MIDSRGLYKGACLLLFFICNDVLVFVCVRERVLFFSLRKFVGFAQQIDYSMGMFDIDSR